MAKIQEKIFNQMVNKLNINQSERLTSKSIETLELIKVKSSEILKHLNDNAKIILCIDINCELLNMPFCDMSLAVQHACLKKTIYSKNKKILQKLLDLNKKMTIDEVIRRLGITHSSAVEKMAKEIFKTYMKEQAYENQEIDPSVFVMSVYFACKFENVKTAKKNVLNLSNLTHKQWGTMEKSWEKWTSGLFNKTKNPKDSKKDKENVEDNQDVNETTNKKIEVTEDYDAWARRIVEAAKAEIRKIK